MALADVFKGANFRTAVIPGSFPLDCPREPIETLGVDHIDITVNDLGRSLPFYSKVLGALGFRRLAHPQYNGFHNANMIIGIKESVAEEKTVTYNRYRVGLHHLALRAKSRQDVDKFYDFLTSEGLTILDSPARYPQYGPQYYAVFFADPDGIKLELVYYPVPWGYWYTTQVESADPQPKPSSDVQR